MVKFSESSRRNDPQKHTKQHEEFRDISCDFVDRLVLTLNYWFVMEDMTLPNKAPRLTLFQTDNYYARGYNTNLYAHV